MSEKIKKKFLITLAIFVLLLFSLIFLFQSKFTGKVIETSEENLVLWLKFDESSGNVAYDASGNGNNCMIYGASWVDGKIGKGLSFDGVDDYVDCGNSSSLNLIDAITVEAWIYPKEISTKNRFIIDKIYSYRLHYTRTYETIPAFYIWNDSAYKATYFRDLPTNSWYHLIGTYDKTTGKVKSYVNGVLINEVSHSGEIRMTGSKMIIGMASTMSGSFNGTIDEVRIYNRVLSNEEIKNKYLKYGCGNNVCEGIEDCHNCQKDCGACREICPDPNNSPYGIGAYISSLNLVENFTKLMSDAGVKFDRESIHWSLVQPQPGVYNWTRYDIIFGNLTANNIEPAPTLVYTPAWASSYPNNTPSENEREPTLYPPKNITDWKNFVNESVKRYGYMTGGKRQIKYWEIWNEPDISYFFNGTPEQLYLMQKEAYLTIKATDPNAIVLSPGFTHMNLKDGGWVDRFLDLGAGQYFDIFNFHIYDPNMVEKLNLAKNLLKKHNIQNKPIWITEMNDKTKGISNETEQAEKLKIRYFELLENGAEKVFWFELMDGKWQNATAGLIRADRSPKPSYYAYKEIAIGCLNKSYCGNSVCEPEQDESCSSCLEDCGICADSGEGRDGGGVRGEGGGRLPQIYQTSLAARESFRLFLQDKIAFEIEGKNYVIELKNSRVSDADFVISGNASRQISLNLNEITEIDLNNDSKADLKISLESAAYGRLNISMEKIEKAGITKFAENIVENIKGVIEEQVKGTTILLSAQQKARWKTTALVLALAACFVFLLSRYLFHEKIVKEQLEKLAEWIDKARDSGYSDGQIRVMLLEKGWGKKIIKKTLGFSRGKLTNP